jgi:tRNA pseudouridine55 synthase
VARKKPHPDFRELDGLVLLDKSRGMTSNAALQHARRLFGAEKGGHTGALDPLATGLLPLCFGEATKIAGLLLAERKAYEAVAQFGVETDTCDAEGEVIATRAVGDLSNLEQHLAPFRGRIRQVPPIYSALKRDGEPLYVKARRGEQVDIEARDVEVFDLRVLEIGATHARLAIECGSGTYIRSLVRDLGASLGCGAHVAELRRTWVDPFRTPRMHTLEQMADARADGSLFSLLLPVEAGLAAFPRVDLDADQARRLGQGQTMFWHGPEREGEYAVFADGRALGFIQIRDGRLMPRRMFKWASFGDSARQRAEA